MKIPFPLSASFAFLTLSTVAFSTEDDRLTREERDRVGHLYAKVIRDKHVQEARHAHEEAVKHYHEVLRQAMIKRDPNILPALTKIRVNPSLLAEAIWEKRNKDILNNLHLPVRRLDAGERNRWNQAMHKLQEKEVTKAFSKQLERNYRQQAKLRKEQNHLMNGFKKEARRELLAEDGGLKSIFEKLEQRPSHSAEEKGSENSTPEEEAKTLEAETELVPPMPVPMPVSTEEC